MAPGLNGGNRGNFLWKNKKAFLKFKESFSGKLLKKGLSLILAILLYQLRE
jgi:hypothetical protein